MLVDFKSFFKIGCLVGICCVSGCAVNRFEASDEHQVAIPVRAHQKIGSGTALAHSARVPGGRIDLNRIRSAAVSSAPESASSDELAATDWNRHSLRDRMQVLSHAQAAETTQPVKAQVSQTVPKAELAQSKSEKDANQFDATEEKIETPTRGVTLTSAHVTLEPELLPIPEANPADKSQVVDPPSFESHDEQVTPLDLPMVLEMVGGQHPIVGLAQWRVQEAYAQLDRANVLWLPSIQTGLSYNRHDGNYQASNGAIVDVNRNSLQYGFGTGAVGAGTTPRPGLVAQFHLTDAIFQPEIAQKRAWASGHAATGTYNSHLLEAALAYLSLLEAEQDLVILKESEQRTRDLSKLTADFSSTGQGLQADADRVRTELKLLESRMAETRERADMASARLSQALSIDAGQRIVPLEPTLVPIQLVSLDVDKQTLIGTGLVNRPELKESQALVAAACSEFKRQKYAPLIPSVLLGASAGSFGGGLGSDSGSFGGRYDFDAAMMWEVRNLGFGEKAARRESEARVEQARFAQMRVLDQVAREVAEAHAQVTHRETRIAISQEAIESAQNSFDRNLSRIREARGLPLEVLQSIRALEEARRAYLSAVVDYNEAQFRLQWALGWPVVAPGEMQ